MNSEVKYRKLYIKCDKLGTPVLQLVLQILKSWSNSQGTVMEKSMNTQYNMIIIYIKSVIRK